MNNKFKKYVAGVSAGALIMGAVGVSSAHADNAPVSGPAVASKIEKIMAPAERDPLVRPLIKQALRDTNKGDYKGASGIMWSVSSIASSEKKANEYNRAIISYNYLQEISANGNAVQSNSSVAAANPQQQVVQVQPPSYTQQPYQQTYTNYAVAQQQAAQYQADVQQQYYAQQYALQEQQIRAQETMNIVNAGMNVLWYAAVVGHR